MTAAAAIAESTAALRRGDALGAITILRRALEATPSDPELRLRLARALDAAGDHAGAETEARALIAQTDSAPAWIELAGALRKRARPLEALEAFDAALARAPGDVRARHNRAIVLHQLARSEEALAEYEDLYNGGLRAAPLYRNWANALMDLGRLEEAEAKLVEAVRLTPDDPILQDNLARMRWLRGDAETYTRDFEDAVARAPDNVMMRLACADLMRRGGRREAAAGMIEKGLARQPGEPALAGALGVVRTELGEAGAAVPLLERALAARPKDWTMRENYVEALLSAGRPADALFEARKGRAALPLNQAWIAQEATALRFTDHAAYARLYDFARMVRAFDLPAPPGFDDVSEFRLQLRERLLDLHKLQAHPIDQSLVNGTQTSKSLLESDDPIIKGFLASVDVVLQRYIAEMPDDRAHPFWSRKPASGRARLVGCWSVRLASGGHHVNHVHPEGWISSAFYVEAPPKTANSPEREGWIEFGAPRWPVPGADAEHALPPVPGRLVLFPSYMWHGTRPFSAETSRMTIAFDAVPD